MVKTSDSTSIRFIHEWDGVGVYACDSCHKEHGEHNGYSFCPHCGRRIVAHRVVRPRHYPKWQYELERRGYKPVIVKCDPPAVLPKQVKMQIDVKYRNPNGFVDTNTEHLYGYAECGSPQRNWQRIIDEIKSTKKEWSGVSELIESCTITFILSNDAPSGYYSTKTVWKKENNEDSSPVVNPSSGTGVCVSW